MKQQETQKELFTPGEWEIQHDTINDYIFSREDAGMQIPICCTYSGKTGRREAKANAALIAQAKNMYYALQKCVDIFKQLADDGKYPEQMLTINGGRGFRFITDILQKANPQL